MSDSSGNNSDMDIEDEVLNSPPETSATWPKWTAQDVREMSKLLKYHTDMISYITLCRGKGPSRDPLPKKHRSDIMTKLYIGKTVRKQDTIPVSKMTGEQFHQYLTSRLSDMSEAETSQEQIPKQLSELPAYLDKIYKNLQYSERKTLQAHFEMGNTFTLAKKQFELEKRKKGIRLTWRMWIEDNTQIKEACARRHREIASLRLAYPKLEKLSMSYSEFLKIKSKIISVFSTNSEIGESWK